jgi:hypothetical protein
VKLDNESLTEVSLGINLPYCFGYIGNWRVSVLSDIDMWGKIALILTSNSICAAKLCGNFLFDQDLGA